MHRNIILTKISNRCQKNILEIINILLNILFVAPIYINYSKLCNKICGPTFLYAINKKNDL